MTKRRAEIDKAEELREVIREANGVMKDLRHTMKQARALIEDIALTAEREVDEYVGPAIEEGLEQFRSTLLRSVDEGTEAVFKRFDDLFTLVIGEDVSEVLVEAQSLRDGTLAEEALKGPAMPPAAGPFQQQSKKVGP